MDKNELNKESVKGKRIKFKREINAEVNDKIEPLKGDALRGYEINKLSKGINSEMPGNDR